MATTFQAVADVAVSQIGRQEADDGTTKYGYWYGNPAGDWCAMFLSWCGDQAAQKTPGASNPYADKENPKGFSYTETWRSWFMGRGAWTASRAGIRAGDLVFFLSPNADPGRSVTHLGLVLQVGAGYYLTIEGNTWDLTSPTSDSKYVVRKHREPTTDGSFVGYGRIQYADDPSGADGYAGADTPIENPLLLSRAVNSFTV